MNIHTASIGYEFSLEASSSSRTVELFKISLRQINRSDKGSRRLLEQTPTTIGRSQDCVVTLNSRSVSREHCAIVFEGSKVLISDLNSRNGTIVQGERLLPQTARRLFHHDQIDIGKYSFRISIRDAVTNRPLLAPPSETNSPSISTLSMPNMENLVPSADDLLNELDQLASTLDVGDVENESVMRQTLTIDQALRDEHEPSDDGDSDEGDSSEQSSTVHATEPQSNGTDETRESHPDELNQGGQKQDEQDEPGKIPRHLLPKAPDDSQDAARKALRDLFMK